jgi:beta-glucosidase
MIRKTNAGLAKRADGKNVQFLDFDDKLLDAQGQVTKEHFVDGVHLTNRGYQIWAREMNPLLTEMLGITASEPAEGGFSFETHRGRRS